MKLALYDTLTRELQTVQSNNSVVNIYCCGPTVYRNAHVGNLRTFLLADLVRRALELEGVEVKLIQNITDVGHMSEDFQAEDKLIMQAGIEKSDPFDIARKYEERFHKDLKELNILPASAYPRASETIDLMLSTISQLIDRKFAYVAQDGSVYFDANSFESYGALSGNKLEALKPGHKFDYSDGGEKRFHADWSLWKAAQNRTEMVWQSPWGVGFPGWHIECTAMSLSLLDSKIDVHIGGIDLRFPHHENERAQSNAIAGSEAVTMWVHGEHLLFEGRKMSKSSGNVVLLQDLIDRGLDPLALRFSLLENRYRAQIDLTWAGLEAANATLRRWRKAISNWGDSDQITVDSEIAQAIAKDLDTPKIMIRLRSIEKDEQFSTEHKRAVFKYADQILGLDLARSTVAALATPEVALMLTERESARSARNWSESDRLRDELQKLGVSVSDSVDGQSWEWI
jgi:cysteinyl-tRNA synthetase